MSAAVAQTGITCTASVANQPTLRQEGATEAAGDILINCTGTLIGAQTGPQTIALYVSGAAITSRQLYTGATPSSIPTEAALLVNDCTTNSGTSSSGASCSPSGTFTGGNPTQGFLQNGALEWTGFTLPTTGAPFQLRLTNIRVNANALAAGAFVTGTVLATFGIQNQQNLVLGDIQSSLSVSVSQPIGSNQQCGQQTIGTVNLTVKELINTAFKSPAANTSGSNSNTIPGQWYQLGVNNESQTVFTPPSNWTNQLGGVLPGQADAGTRIRVNVSNIPGGASVSLPVNVNTANGSLAATSSGDLGPFSQVGSAISLTSSGSVTYEVRAQSGSSIDSFTIPISVSGAGTTGAGTMLVSATYAATTAESTAAIPRFADTSVLTPSFNFLSCLPATHLSFNTQPVGGIANAVLAPVTVSALDVFGNVTATNPSITLTSTPSAINVSANGVAGVATFNTLVSSSPGTYTLTASSVGLAPITSNPIVIKGPTTTTLSLSAGSARYGQSVTLTASVTPLAGTGIITFYDGTTILGTAPLSAGQAQFTTTLLASGTRMLQARYGGNPTYSRSTSISIPVNINAVAANILQPAVNYSVGTGPAAVAVADLNRDGIADLIVADNPAGNITVRLGNGAGTFRTPAFYGVGNQPVAIATGDFNADGQTDVAVANSQDGTVSILIGKGDGTFQTATSFAAGPDPMSLAVADFNGDGIADIVVANFITGGGLNYTTNVGIFLGNGDGTFQSPINYAAGDSPNSLAVGDFNSDGIPDIAVANLNNNNVTVFLGNGDGTMQLVGNYSVSASGSVGPVSIVVADLNGDGSPDLATANLNGNNISVLLGNGNGTFGLPATYSAGTNPYSIAAGDFNGDGKVDLAVANVSNATVSVFLGNGNGTFQTAVNYPASASPESVAVGDFNGDGRTDLAVANYSNSTVSVLLGANASWFTISGRITLSGAGLAGVSVALSGSQTASTTTDSSGNYSFSGLLPGGPYTVTPSAAGFSFAPSNQAFANLANNQTANFTAAPTGNNLVVSGQVAVSGTALGGVTINVTGSQTTSTTTDSSGAYTLVLAKNGTHTLSAALTGYSFSPPVTFSNLTTNQTANFTGIAIAGLEFYPVTPCRLVDTRVSSFQAGFGPPSLVGGATRTFNIPSNTVCGIPSNAAAYSFNVTVVTKGYLGYLSIWPAGQPIPNVSTLNSYSTNSTAVANAAIVPAGAGGAINVYVTDATDLVLDIDGYFAPPATNGLEFYPVTPCRLVDTRVSSFPSGFGPPTFAAGATRTFTIPNNTVCAIPSTAAAYSLNVTAVPQKTLGFLSIWPAGKPLPNVSTLNVYTQGTVVANAAVVPAGTIGAINAYVTDATDLVIDINGYFAPPGTNGLNFYPVIPCRVADTRTAAGFGGPFGPSTMGAGTQRSFPVPSSSCGIPSNAGAYSFNFTAVPQAPQLGIFITWPTGQPQPNVSTMNSYNGSVVANAAVVPAGTGGAISVYVTDKSDVLFDVNGYFAP